jgi:hypothetical protein
MYVAVIDDRVTLKMGPRYDMGCHLPREAQGWKFVASGKDWAGECAFYRAALRANSVVLICGGGCRARAVMCG